jgi:choline-glycine betaine transporter
MCLNKKVIAGLVVAGVAVYLLAPDLIGAALPLLVLAACPLSMVVMMRAMSKDRAASSPEGAGADADADEVSALRTEVARLRMERDHPGDAPVGEPR